MGRRRTNPVICRAKAKRSKPRIFTPKDLGRVACLCLEQGYTVDAMLAELEKCAPCQNRRRRRADRRMVEALKQNNDVLNDFQTTLTVTDVAMKGILLLTRFIPALRSTQIPVTASRQLIAATVTRIGARIAANDALYESLIREIPLAA